MQSTTCLKLKNSAGAFMMSVDLSLISG